MCIYDRVMLTKAASAAPVINQISPENPVSVVDNYSYKVFSVKKVQKGTKNSTRKLGCDQLVRCENVHLL